MTRHLLVVGAQRSGTTYLSRMLDAHPDITMARPARPEPKVFCSDERAAMGLSGYRETYFGHASGERLLGEKSTSYLEDPEAARRAAAVLGEAEIVVSLRDPVARAVSNWRFSTDNGLESRPLEEALRADLEDRRRDWDRASVSVSPFVYVRRGRYDDYLDTWWRMFPDHVHVCFLEEMVAGPEAVQRLYRSLGVDPGIVPADVDTVVNDSREPATTLSADLRTELDRYYAPADARLRARLRRELPWRASGDGAEERTRVTAPGKGRENAREQGSNHVG
jgi:hypothetical protein